MMMVDKKKHQKYRKAGKRKVQVPSRPLSKDMHIRLIGKLSVGANVREQLLLRVGIDLLEHG